MTKARGMTLIEMGVALMLAALLVTVMVPAFSVVTRAQLRSRSGELAGAIRAMYGYTAIQGKSCRLAFDLDAGAYWPECAKGTVRLSRDQERSQGGVRLESREEETAAKLAETQARSRDLSDRDKVRAELIAKEQFSAANVPDLKKVDLGKQVKFSDVWVQHQPERYTAGKAFLYFWPSGLTESAGIRLAQGDDVYTLVVSPLTGRVKVVIGRVDAPGEKG
jgi:general secretion pathway protein H